MLTSLLSAKAAAAAVAAVTVMGGAAAAYAGALPAPAQQLAHNTIGAPSPASSHSPGGPQATPAGPDASGPAAFGLCTAYAHAKAHGSASQQSVAFRNLAAAAGGAAKIAAYCATVPHPGSSHAGGRPTAVPSHSHPAGQPSTPPSQAAGQATSHPTGKPTALPTTHPTGKPTGAPTN